MGESIAEMFFLTAVDETSGRLHVRMDVLQCGVTAGVFADLALARLVLIDEAGLVLLSSAPPPGVADPAASYVVEAVARQSRTFSVRRWIEEIGAAVFELVCRRLLDAEVIKREQVGVVRRHVVFPPASRVAAAAPRLELTRMLRDPQQFTLGMGVVGVLAGIGGLDGTFRAELSKARIREVLAELVDNLPRDLRAIVDGVRTVTSDGALMPRR